MTVTRWIVRGLSALLALALLAAALLAIAEIVAAATGKGPWLVQYPEWTTWLQQRTWTDPVVRAILVGMVVVGLVLIVLALRRGRPAALALRPRTDGVDVRVSRRSLERSLVAAASRTAGVAEADASVRRTQARIEAKPASRFESGVKQDVESAVRARLDSLGLARPLRLRVLVSSKERR